MFNARRVSVVVSLALVVACSGPAQPTPLTQSIGGVDTPAASPSAPLANPMRVASDESEEVALGDVEGDLDVLSASAMTFKFAGKINSGNFAPRGTKFTGSFVFNPAARDSNKRAGEGTYKMPAPNGMMLNVAGRSPMTNYKGLTIWVGNNVDNKDWYEVEPTIQSNIEMYLSLRTSNKSAFLTDKLPLTPPRISSAMFWGALDLYVNNKSASGTITSVTK